MRLLRVTLDRAPWDPAEALAGRHEPARGAQWSLDGLGPALTAVTAGYDAPLRGLAELVSHLLAGQAVLGLGRGAWRAGSADLARGDERFRLRRGGSPERPLLTIAPLAPGRGGAPPQRPPAGGPMAWLAGAPAEAVGAIFFHTGAAEPGDDLHALLSPGVAAAVRGLATRGAASASGDPAAPPDLATRQPSGVRGLEEDERRRAALGRRDELAERIEATLADRRGESQRLEGRLADVARELADIEQRITETGRQARQLTAELSADESRARYAELTRVAAEAEGRQAADDWRPRVERIDAGVARWRATLAELDDRETELRGELARVHPDDAAPELPLADQRAAVAVALRLTADLESEVARFARAGDSPRCVCQDAHPRLNPLVETLGEQLRRLEALVSQQDRALRAAELRDELEQLDRSRAALRRQLERLLERRQTLYRTSRARAGGAEKTPRAPAIDRDRLEARLGELTETLRALHARRDAIEAERADLYERRRAAIESSELARLQRELEAVQRSLDAAPARRAASRRHEPLRASDVLARLSDGDLVELRLVAGGREVAVRDREGREHGGAALAGEAQRLVAWSLRLALADACCAAGVELPIVADEPFEGLADRFAANLAVELDDYCRRGWQAIVLTRREAALGRLRSLGVVVRTLGDSADAIATRDEIVPPRPPRPIEAPAAAPRANPPSQRRFVVDVDDPIDRFPVAVADRARLFAQARLRTAGELLGADPSAVAEEMATPGVTAELVALWQAHLALVAFVPGLSLAEAQSLAEAGVLSVEELADADADRLAASLQGAGPWADTERVAQWIELAHEELPRWSRDGWAEAWRRNRAERSQRIAENARRRAAPGARAAHADNGGGEQTQGREGRANRAAADDRSARAPRTRAEMRRRSRGQLAAPTATKKPAHRGDAKQSPRFFLEWTSPVVDAPSIGERRAEQLRAIGVRTVSDLLRADAGSVAQRLADPRVDAQRVVAWQHQAELVCRVPGLRGHDAQVLVGAGITTAEEIASMRPDELLGFVEPFCDSAEGQRALRGSPRPDLAEVAEWIGGAKRRRQTGSP